MSTPELSRRTAMNRRQFALSLAAGVSGLSFLPHALAATDYPNKNARIICPFAPGGSGDISSRLFADHFKAATGQTLVVENRAGASGGIGAAAVKNTNPDGYTLMLSTQSILIANELFYKSLPYDPKDFVTVGLMGTSGMYMLVNPSAPYKTVGEFVTYAKANPETTPSAHFNSSSRIGAAIFASRAGIRLNEVPYKEVGQAVIDLSAGRLAYIFLDTIAAAQHIQAGSLKPIAITSGERSKINPDVPTLSEMFPDTEIVAFLSFSVAKEVPREIQEKLNLLITGMTGSPAMQPRLETLGLTSRQLDLAAMAAFVEVERRRWTEYVAIARIEKE
jgi:tripartite-type tricarboxylate transporter receptor subunit TctC